MVVTISPRHSVKTRITLASLAIFLVSIWLLAFYISQMLRQDMTRLLGEQQFSTTALVATQVNQELALRVNALELVARALTPDLLENPPALKKFLDDRIVLLTLFNAGSHVVGRNGVVMADVSDVANRVGTDYSRGLGIQAAMTEEKTTIGNPVMGLLLKRPIFSISTPLRDVQGRVIGALTGVTDLDKPSFLDLISGSRYGQTGGFFLVAQNDRRIITASGKRHVMQALPASGVNPVIDRFLQGFEGSSVVATPNPLDVEVLSAVKAVPLSDWLVATVLPTAEAFAPIHDLQQHMLLATIFLTVLAAGLTWWLLGRQLAPLLNAAKTLAHQDETQQPHQPLPIAYPDEIGELITGFNRVLDTLAQREALLRQILNTSSVAIFFIDDQGCIQQANQRMAEMFGLPLNQLEGLPYTSLIHPSERHIGQQKMLALLVSEIESVDLDRLYQRADQTEFWGHLTGQRFYDAQGKKSGLVGVIIDITQRKADEAEIRSLAFFDPLTSLPNRRLLLDRLTHALTGALRHHRYGALLFIDLDNFKTINDTLGHDKGDLLLQQVARRLSACIRDSDTVARLGGDEFVVMLEDLSEDIKEATEQAAGVGEKIRHALNQSYQLNNNAHHSTPSIGITLFGDQPETIDEPLKRADLAMYQAKAAGRNAVCFFEPQMQAVVTTRAELETHLHEAIAKKQFVLYYQAQVASDHRLTGAEALVRWLHPERGMVSPAEFIPLAEESGLILPLGAWVLETACTQLALWGHQASMAHLTLAVNVSARQFLQPDFVEQVLAMLTRTGANPQHLKLELTESLMVSNVEDVIAKMMALKTLGVGFSLDDFGTGYSSLAYLKRLPLDQLKIDQGFVRDILIDPNDAAIAKMVVALANSMGLAVIAEGVETEEQRCFLAEQGCHAYQGYLFSRPLPLAEFEHFVTLSLSLPL